jgi:calpain-5
MRNPWSSEDYVGAWSDSDSIWNTVSAAEKQRIGHVKADDGIFFFPLDKFQ